MSRLLNDHPFSYENIMENPKKDHQIIKVKEDWYKPMTYTVMETGGFIKLYTNRGMTYWISQNAQNHETPDWKLHFSIDKLDISNAWNILAKLFIELRCEIGIKVTSVGNDFCDTQQMGREITVYIYVYDQRYGNGVMYVNNINGVPIFLCDDQHVDESEYYLGSEHESVYDAVFWYKFICEAENRLSCHNIKSNGLASGDLPLPHCKYASLRNEAFVTIDGQLIYPPNECAWNAKKHRNPLEETVYMLLLQRL